MTMMTYAEAIREGMSIRMRENPNVVLFGEDVGAFGGCFGVSAGMFDEFGPERVRDTPISEGAIIGCAVGAAATERQLPIYAVQEDEKEKKAALTFDAAWGDASLRQPEEEAGERP